MSREVRTAYTIPVNSDEGEYSGLAPMWLFNWLTVYTSVMELTKHVVATAWSETVVTVYEYISGCGM